jgi:hypothetical protein
VSTAGAPARQVIFAGLGIGAAVATIWLRYWLNNRFFFIDDAQAQVYPALHEIARLLKSGNPPWVSLRSWYGGNFAGEYVYGVFNPVSLLLIALIGGMNDLAQAAAILVGAHIALAGLGAFCLARHLGVSPPYAALASFATATNNFLLFWYGTAWFAGLVGFTWFVWAIFFLLRAADRAAQILPAAIAVFLVWTSGYPASVLATALFMLGYLGALVGVGRSWAVIGRSAVAGIAGTLMSLPALVPAWALYGQSLRSSADTYVTTFLSGSFTGLFSFSFPSFLPVMQTWGPSFIGKYGVVEMPFYYVGWFLLPALVYLDWGLLRRQKPADLVGLLVATVGFLILCRLPSLSLFRWSFKYIPYYGTASVLLGVSILSRPALLRLTWRRTMIGIAIVAVLAAVAISSSPTYWDVHLLSCMVLCGGLIGFFRLGLKSGDRAALYTLLLSVAVIAASCGVWGRNAELPDPGLTSKVALARFLGSEGRGQTVLNAADAFCCDLTHYDRRTPAPDEPGPELVARRSFAFGNVGYLSENHFINGYSTMQPAHLHRELCINHPWGLVCDEIFERLFQVDEATGVTVAELMGLDVIAVPHGEKMRRFMALAPAEWRRYRESDTGAAYRREGGHGGLPGTLSWVAEGVRVSDVVQRGLSETLRIAVDPSRTEPLLIFGRAWYPGYRARLDGQEIEVKPHRGYMVAVRLPKEARRAGVLELDYRLPGMPWSGMLAGVGLLLAVGAATWLPRDSS